MPPLGPRSAAVIAALLLGAAGCPADPQLADGAAPDAELGLSEAGLARCLRPKHYCTPADPCGLNPRCSEDLVCVTEGRRDCDDGIDCTTDSCIHGGCQHVIKDGMCMIEGVCYKKGDTKQCGRCAPDKKQSGWSPLDGVPCDDSNTCTKGDECRDGVCVGQAYNCSDNQPCTTDSCDGLGGCSHFLKPMFCQIEKTCYQHQETDTTGCKICDVTVSQKNWQTRKNVCTINSKCYGEGSNDSTGCYVCDLHTPQQWTAVSDKCLIGQLCLKKGAVHTSQCATCDPDKTKSQWTPIPGASLLVTTFNKGLSGYKTTATVGGVGWQLSTDRYISSPQSLYYGDPSTKTYDNGKPNKGTATAPAVTLPSGKKSYLTFQVYMDTEKTNKYDVLSVEVDGKEVWAKDTKTMKITDYQRWVQITIDLSADAGKSITIAFSFDTGDDLNNKSEGVYIDDVTLLTGCQ